MNTDCLRLYEESELGKDGYPNRWHVGEVHSIRSLIDNNGTPDQGIKHIVRNLAGHRCVRCQHPYRSEIAGERGEWSPCDDRCEHGGPMRVWTRLGAGEEGWSDFDPTPAACGPAVAAVAPAAVEAQWRILTVHHLNGRKEDCRWHNLVPLCQRCHLQIQGRVRMEQLFPHEHSSWFKAYAAAYYASVYLGEELTRHETMTRLDELLALERIA